MNTSTTAGFFMLFLATACGGSAAEQSGVAGITAGATGTPIADDSAAAGHDTAGANAAVGHDNAGGSGGSGGGAADPGGMSGTCPAVEYSSHADITADSPISVTDADTATFTACRNSECYSGKAPSNGVTNTRMLDGTIFNPGVTLTFYDAGPSVTMVWSALDLRDGDELKLSVASTVDQTPIAIFDTVVTYHPEILDPTLADEGFSQLCSQVSVARVDLRSSK